MIPLFPHSKAAVIGIIAHECAHQISYLQRPFIAKWFWLASYYHCNKRRLEVESEADIIAIKRGYGKEILANALVQRKRNAKDPVRMRIVKEGYPSPAMVRRWINS